MSSCVELAPLYAAATQRSSGRPAAPARRHVSQDLRVWQSAVGSAGLAQCASCARNEAARVRPPRLLPPWRPSTFCASTATLQSWQAPRGRHFRKRTDPVPRARGMRATRPRRREAGVGPAQVGPRAGEPSKRGRKPASASHACSRAAPLDIDGPAPEAPPRECSALTGRRKRGRMCNRLTSRWRVREKASDPERPRGAAVDAAGGRRPFLPAAPAVAAPAFSRRAHCPPRPKRPTSGAGSLRSVALCSRSGAL